MGDFPALEEIPATEELVEGSFKSVLVNSYERNQKARKQCIDHFGCVCICCGFDFELAYGELGKGYIHVYHVKPLSEIKESYIVDPINDLVPLCANCHAIVHRANPALTTKQLRIIVKKI